MMQFHNMRVELYPPWIRLAPLCEEFNTKQAAFLINDNEIIIAQGSEVNTYNLILNEWSTEEHTEFLAAAGKYTSDMNTQCLYQYQYNQLLKLNLNTKQITAYKMHNEILSNFVPIKIGSDHHIIYGYRYSYHKIWNEDDPEKAAKLIHSFTAKNNFNSQLSSRGIYIESKKEILTFGGIIGGTYHDSIWRYSLDKKKWDLLDCKMPKRLEGFGCVITTDEQYVIIFGGWSTNKAGKHGKRTDDIHVLNLMEMEWKECRLKCPIIELCYGMIVPGKRDEDNVISAFIRFVCDGVNVEEIPMDIMKLIDEMYGENERVHLFFRDHVDHCAINVSDILVNC